MSKTKNKKVKYKELTDENKDYIALIYHDDSLNHEEKMEILSKKFGVKGRTIRDWWIKLELSIPKSKLPKQLIEARDRSIEKDTEILLVTSAQNETMINRNQWQTMNMFADELTKLGKKTEIAIIPIRYRNPTSPSEDVKKKKDMWWVDEIKDRLFYNKIEFGDTLISANSHVRPTAKMPLTGFESLANNNHLILGSPRIHFQPQPRFRGSDLRIMATTGSITRKNYSRSKAGDTGFIHHSYGFTIIEKKKDGTCYIPRNVYVTDDGSFTDLIYNVSVDGITKQKTVQAIIWGDIHREQISKKIYKKTQKICKLLTPKIHVLHDVLDGYRFNPHERKDTFVMRKKIMQGKYLIKDEVEQAVEFPSELLNKCGGDEVYVVESNHDVFLDRHITDMNWKNDLHNSPAYLEYAYIQQTIDLEDYGNIYGYLIYNKYKNKKIKYLKYGSNLRVNGFNLALHGDFGVNGSRGNIRTFKRLNEKIIHGHNHSPFIMDGVTSVGLTAKVDQYYTRKGMSTHANAHCLIHDNGKRQLLVFDNEAEISGLI